MKWQKMLCAAVEHRRILEILYSDGVRRIIRPHVYGLNTAGHYAVSTFRTMKVGFPDQPDWRTYLEAEILAAKETGDAFEEPSEGYNPDSKAFSRVICKV